MTGQGLAVRPATAEDVPFLLGLLADPATAEYLAVTELDGAALMAELTAEDIGRLVATREGQPVAGLRWLLINRRSRIAELSEIAVDPRVRGQGVGVALVRAACGLLFDRGEHRVQLEVYGDNPTARRAFERAGFRHEGTRRRAYRRRGDWQDGLLFGLLADELD